MSKKENKGYTKKELKQIETIMKTGNDLAKYIRNNGKEKCKYYPIELVDPDTRRTVYYGSLHEFVTEYNNARAKGIPTFSIKNRTYETFTERTERLKTDLIDEAGYIWAQSAGTKDNRLMEKVEEFEKCGGKQLMLASYKETNNMRHPELHPFFVTTTAKQCQNELRNDFYKNSTTGSKGKRTGKKENVPTNSYKNKMKNLLLKVLIVTTLLEGAVIYNQADNIMEDFAERTAVSSLVGTVQDEVIADNTYRVNNNKDYAYAWHNQGIMDGISTEIKPLTDLNPAAAIYLVDQATDYTTADQVANELYDGTFSEAMQASGFKDEDDLREYLYDNKEALEQMIEEGHTNIQITGGTNTLK